MEVEAEALEVDEDDVDVEVEEDVGLDLVNFCLGLTRGTIFKGIFMPWVSTMAWGTGMMTLGEA